MSLDHLRDENDKIILSTASLCSSKLTKRLPSQRQLQLDIQHYLARLQELDAEISRQTDKDQSHSISSIDNESFHMSIRDRTAHSERSSLWIEVSLLYLHQ